MNIIYTCFWEKVKENTWSGTTYSLFKALSKKENVNDFEIKFTIYEKILIKLCSIKFRKGKIVIDDEFNKIKLYFTDRKIKSISKSQNKDVVIEIGDLGVCSNRTYIYQDLSVDSLKYFKDNDKEAFEYSTFQEISEKEFIYRNIKQKYIYNNSMGIFTMSKWLAENLVNYSDIPCEKVHYVGGGINVDKSKIVDVKKNNNKILFVGRDFYRKGGDLVYDAFKILKNKYVNNAELFVAGPKEWPLDEMIEGVNFLGEVGTDELSKYFNECDIFCMPSRFEAYGIVFIEALVYGLPCIGRNKFAMKEFIKDDENGYLINEDNADKLAERMYKLLNCQRIKDNVLNKRKEYLDEYSWDRVAERIITIIKSDCNKLGGI